MKTRVPETNATPSSTASTVISSLVLCASTLRKAVRNMGVFSAVGRAGRDDRAGDEPGSGQRAGTGRPDRGASRIEEASPDRVSEPTRAARVGGEPARGPPGSKKRARIG
ncbi:hypothetical protein GCM10018772_32890 [Streptomyces fumanus]|uniref:Uncharacterized protein n=1 Tax=Streptomyces fumanus TaxID=67302 RepID=A0A919AGR4_9ACTN|nr:hypothetical protein GCM10018772_32890 [Streptomyces fumanus]